MVIIMVMIGWLCYKDCYFGRNGKKICDRGMKEGRNDGIAGSGAGALHGRAWTCLDVPGLLFPRQRPTAYSYRAGSTAHMSHEP